MPVEHACLALQHGSRAMASSTFPESLCWLELPTHSCTIFSEVWSGTCKASQWHSAWHNFGCMHSAWHNFGCMHGRLRFPGRPPIRRESVALTTVFHILSDILSKKIGKAIRCGGL